MLFLFGIGVRISFGGILGDLVVRNSVRLNDTLITFDSDGDFILARRFGVGLN